MSDKTDGMSDLFRSARGQTLEQPTEPKQKQRPFRSDVFRPTEVEVPPLRRNAPGDRYQSFLDKYDDLERFIDGFTPQDLMYYFREKAKEAGYKYHIANMKRDMGIYKKLLESYSAREVALMIEFIFFSNQDYLNTSKTQPTVLASAYVNTIYTDALLWADDKYVPGQREKKKQRPTIKKREWKNTKPQEERSKIGEW